ADYCGAEKLRPRWLPVGCTPAGSNVVSSVGLTFLTYGHATAAANAVFHVCLRGAKPPPDPPPSTWMVCYAADAPPPEVEPTWTITVHGKWRFWHVVRCTGIPGRASGTRLFYGASAVTYAGKPWNEWTTNTIHPENYSCPAI